MTSLAQIRPAHRATAARRADSRRPSAIERRSAHASGSRPAGPARKDHLGALLARAVAARDRRSRPPWAEPPRGVTVGAMLQRAPKTIVQHGEMSGDMFQIAVALLADPELHVYLIGARQPSTRDKAQQIFDFYVRMTGIDDGRVILKLIDGDVSKETKRILSTQKDPEWEHQAASVGEATNILRARFLGDRKLTAKVREAWISSSGVSDDWIDKVIKRRAIPLEDPLVVLWSRQSGAMGGLHPDLDSSYTGIGQLAERFASEGYAVLIVGDDPKRKIVSKKLDTEKEEIVAERDAYARAVRLGEFWSSDLQGKPRTTQFQFFERLRQLVPTLTHIGMRSGNLEAYAYMGHRVLFLEEGNRSDATRMHKLVGLNTVLKYRTVKLHELPTRTGKVLMDTPTRPLNEEGVGGKVNTSSDERFSHQRTIEGKLGDLAAWKKTYDAAALESATSKDRRAKEKLDTTLTTKDLKLLVAYRKFLVQQELTAPHQKKLKAYEWLKSECPELAPSEKHKGFVASDVDAIVETTKGSMSGLDPRGSFWCVTVPETHIAKFIKNLHGVVKAGQTWVGTDGETYVLADVRREFERISIKGSDPHIESTIMFDFVRQPWIA